MDLVQHLLQFFHQPERRCEFNNVMQAMSTCFSVASLNMMRHGRVVQRLEESVARAEAAADPLAPILRRSYDQLQRWVRQDVVCPLPEQELGALYEI